MPCDWWGEFGLRTQIFAPTMGQPISLVASMPNVLLVHPSVPAKTLKELGRHFGKQQ